MAKIDLVIFDFDGTLVDTAPDLIRSTNLYLQGKGITPLSEARIRSEIGMGLKKLILEVYPNLQDSDDATKRQIEAEFIAVYEREYLHSPMLFPGAWEFLTEWDRKIAIVSNKRSRFIHPILKKVEAHTLPWTAIIGGDTYSNMKPHPEPLLKAIAAAGSEPETTLIVGDGHPDVKGALAIGSRCLAVEFGYTSAAELMDLGAWATLPSFAELLPMIESIA